MTGLRIAVLSVHTSPLARPGGNKAGGLNVYVVELARQLGAELAIDATSANAIEQVVDLTKGGAQGVLVTAVSPAAFSQALGMVRRKGTVSLVGLPPGNFPVPIFDVVLKRITIRGSIVGTRKDLAEAVQFAAAGKVKAHVHRARLEDINEVFANLKAGKVDGRVVLDLS